MQNCITKKSHRKSSEGEKPGEVEKRPPSTKHVEKGLEKSRPKSPEEKIDKDARSRIDDVVSNDKTVAKPGGEEKRNPSKVEQRYVFICFSLSIGLYLVLYRVYTSFSSLYLGFLFISCFLHCISFSC